jgi:hypothetical protein
MELLRKYGVQTDLYFPLIKRGAQDFALAADYTYAAGDFKISKDGGAAANPTNSPSAVTMGNGAMWKLTLTATEMQCALLELVIADAATKAIEDQMLSIATYGHASGQYQVDLSDGVRAGLTALPNAAAAASGGVPILGTNAFAISYTAGFTISNAAGDALTLTSSGGNGTGLKSTGNGTGHGIHGTGGATGVGIAGTGGSTSGSGINGAAAAGNSSGINGAGNGTGSGFRGVGGIDGNGFLGVGGTTSGEGAQFQGTASGMRGMNLVGVGAGAGLRTQGGITGPGLRSIGGNTSGHAVQLETTNGDGINSAPTLGHGANFIGAGTDKDGLRTAKGTGTGVDIRGELGSLLTESYAAKNAQGTIAQFLYELVQILEETTGGTTTLTTRKRDQSTTALTRTVNNANDPSTITRAT